MDNTIILYLIKASVSIALFYGLYMLFLKGDTFFKVRRAYFLFAILFSLSFPAFVLEMPVEQNLEAESPTYMHWFSDTELENAVDDIVGDESSFNIWLLIVITAVFVSIVLLFRFIVQFASIARLRVINPTYKDSSLRIIDLKNSTMSPFSFFNWIFINTEFYNEERLKEIIAHEKVHARQLHSIDVILYQILCVFFWWNPFVWLLRNEMRLNLEYLADRGVLQAGFNSKEYQYILLQTSNRNTGIPIINNFNVSQLKKRITMMNKKQTSVFKAMKYMLALPLGAVLLLGNSVQASSELSEMLPEGLSKIATIESIAKEFSEVPVTKVFENIKIEPATVIGGKIASEEETPPAFPGGEEALYKFIANNLKYPVSAEKAGIQGKVVAKATIDKTGKIGEIEIVSESDQSLNDEVIRIIRSMPKWDPAKKGERAVDAEIAVPVTFLLRSGEQLAKAKVGVLGKNVYRLDTTVILAKFTPSIDQYLQDERPFFDLEIPPKFPGGSDALLKFISDNLKYPVSAQEAGISGRVVLRFIITKAGKIKDVEILRSLHPACDKEAIRVLNSMPDWIPGTYDGEPVDMLYNLPFSFQLDDNQTEKVEAKDVLGVKKEEIKETENVEAKNVSNDKDKIYTVVDKQPEFKGGSKAMYKFVSDNLNYPIDAQEAGLSGRVVIKFIVAKTGKVKNPEVLRGFDPACDKEAVRMVLSMPDWTPGQQGGKAVDVYYTLPIHFVLDK